MRAKETSEVTISEEISDNSSEELPKDIDFEERKNIIRKELRKLLGPPKSAQKILEDRRLKNKKFEKNKTRRKLALKSQRRNWE